MGGTILGGGNLPRLLRSVGGVVCLRAELLNGAPPCGRGSARWAEPRPGRGGFIGCLPRNFLDPARAGGVPWSCGGCTSAGSLGLARGEWERSPRPGSTFRGRGRTGGPRAAAARGLGSAALFGGRPAGLWASAPGRGPVFGQVCFHPFPRGGWRKALPSVKRLPEAKR